MNEKTTIAKTLLNLIGSMTLSFNSSFETGNNFDFCWPLALFYTVKTRRNNRNPDYLAT